MGPKIGLRWGSWLWAAIICLMINESWTTFNTDFSSGDTCFCKLQGQIDDCSCTIDTVDFYNNVKITPRINSLMTHDYFRFYRINLKRQCPFWVDDGRCFLEDCLVKPCEETDVPPGLKPATYFTKYSKDAQESGCNNENELGYLNTSISEKSIEEFERWRKHDEASSDNFCELDDETSIDMAYVDLMLNPERYTGYKGDSAHRIWNIIYQENCFKPQIGYESYIDSKNIGGLCLEKRVFYRAISGFHASINIHLCANYMFPAKDAFSKPTWGPNLHEFLQRFSPETTKGEGPQWLKNLYFVFLLELRALVKAAPYLENESFYTGKDDADSDVRKAIKDILHISRDFPDQFNESSMFSGDEAQANALKEEFKVHFRNISRIMDCVGCDKCKLWGKLQIQGLGTAFKILFAGDNKGDKFSLNQMRRAKFQLQRTEIVALVNGFSRLSNSIQVLETFRNMMRR